MRSIYILITTVILLVFAIIFTLRTEKINWDNWREDGVVLHWDYVDSTTRTFPQVLEVNYFERENDLFNLFVLSEKSRVRRNKENKSQGEYSAEVIFGTTWEEIALVYFPEQWGSYRHLELDIYNPQKSRLRLQFRIGDLFDAKSFYVTSQKFKKELELEEGWNKLKFSIEEIAEKIDVNSSHKTIHLSFFPRVGEKVYLDNFRLTKR